MMYNINGDGVGPKFGMNLLRAMWHSSFQGEEKFTRKKERRFCWVFFWSTLIREICQLSVEPFPSYNTHTHTHTP